MTRNIANSIIRKYLQKGVTINSLRNALQYKTAERCKGTITDINYSIYTDDLGRLYINNYELVVPDFISGDHKIRYSSDRSCPFVIEGATMTLDHPISFHMDGLSRVADDNSFNFDGKQFSIKTIRHSRNGNTWTEITSAGVTLRYASYWCDGERCAALPVDEVLAELAANPSKFAYEFYVKTLRH